MFTRELCKVVAGVAVLALNLSAAGNPFIGAWKLNATQSKLEGTGLGPDAMLRMEKEGPGLRVSIDASIQGEANHFTYTATPDGKPAKLSGSPVIDEITFRQINSRTMTSTATKDGKVFFTDRSVVSEDGKRLTIERAGVNPTGEKYHARLVFDRQ